MGPSRIHNSSGVAGDTDTHGCKNAQTGWQTRRETLDSVVKGSHTATAQCKGWLFRRFKFMHRLVRFKSAEMLPVFTSGLHLLCSLLSSSMQEQAQSAGSTAQGGRRRGGSMRGKETP